MPNMIKFLGTAGVLFLVGCSNTTGPGNNQRILFGWAAGDPKDSSAVVIRTMNGGDQWTTCGAHGEIPPVYMSCIEAVDVSTVWLTGDVWDGHGLVMRSENSGSTWQRKGGTKIFQDEGVNSIHSLDRNTSWVSGSNGSIYFTTDAGENWIQKNDSQSAGFILSGIKSFNSQVVWAVGGTTVGVTEGVVLRTTDGGVTWKRQGQGTEIDHHYLITISAPDTSCAWAVGNGYIVMRTTDGGQIWTNVSPLLVSDNDANGIVAFDHNTAWVVMDYNNVFFTSDGGQSWDKQTVPVTDQFITRISALSRNEAWAVGSQSNSPFNHGAILHTTDGGNTWIEQTNPWASNLYPVSFYGEVR